MQLWNNFAAKHPAAAKWVREGGLFVIVSNLVTVFKYMVKSISSIDGANEGFYHGMMLGLCAILGNRYKI